MRRNNLLAERFKSQMRVARGKTYNLMTVMRDHCKMRTIPIRMTKPAKVSRLRRSRESKSMIIYMGLRTLILRVVLL
jgi:hypothetical protein